THMISTCAAAFFIHFSFFFFNDTATTEIYTTRHTLSLHDALPISCCAARTSRCTAPKSRARASRSTKRSSMATPTRSEEHTSELQSRLVISYAVFCLKKKKQKPTPPHANTSST